MKKLLLFILLLIAIQSVRAAVPPPGFVRETLLSGDYFINRAGDSIGVTNDLDTLWFTAVSIRNAQVIDFNTGQPDPIHQEGRLFYSSVTNCLAYMNNEGTLVINLGYESLVRGRNVTGSTIFDGKVVYIDGAQGGQPKFNLADADFPATSIVIAVATQNVLHNGIGSATTHGTVNDINTSAFADGAIVYLSQTPGEITMVQPSPPAANVIVGVIQQAHASVGKLLVTINLSKSLNDLSDVDIAGVGIGDVLMWNGVTWNDSTLDTSMITGIATFVETRIGDTANVLRPEMADTASARYDSTMQHLEGMSYDKPILTVVNDNGLFVDVEKDGGGNIVFRLGGGESVLDCVTGSGVGGKARVAITAAADSISEVWNRIYITNSGGVATLQSQTSNPSGAFTWVGDVIVQDTASFNRNGPLGIQRYTEAFVNDGRGTESHSRQKLRSLGASYQSGIVPISLRITVNAGLDSVNFVGTAGIVDQMHPQIWPAFVDGPYYFGNGQFPGGRMEDLNGALFIQDGTPISNAYFNWIIWGVINQTTATCKIHVNLPSEVFLTESGAISGDFANDYSAPISRRQKAFLIGKAVMRHQSGGGGTLTQVQFSSLLGQPMGVRSAGAVSTPPITEFADSDFRVLGNDPTKQIALEADGITAGNTRTMIVPDLSDTIATVSRMREAIEDSLNQYGPLAGTPSITGNWLNTAFPWADNEIADNITASNYLALIGGILNGDLNMNDNDIIGVNKITTDTVIANIVTADTVVTEKVNVTGTASGTITLIGATSGSQAITVADVAGTPTELTLPTGGDPADGTFLEWNTGGLLAWAVGGGSVDSAGVAASTQLWSSDNPWLMRFSPNFNVTSGDSSGTDTISVALDTTSTIVVGAAYKTSSADPDNELATKGFVASAGVSVDKFIGNLTVTGVLNQWNRKFNANVNNAQSPYASVYIEPPYYTGIDPQDSSGQFVHPTEIYVPEGFGPRLSKYIMGITPLLDIPTGDTTENPCLYVSDDGQNYDSISDINPLSNPSEWGAAVDHLADPDITLGFDNILWYLYTVGYDATTSGLSKVVASFSEDLLTWDTVTLVDTTTFLVSPTMRIDSGNTYDMLYVVKTPKATRPDTLLKVTWDDGATFVEVPTVVVKVESDSVNGTWVADPNAPARAVYVETISGDTVTFIPGVVNLIPPDTSTDQIWHIGNVQPRGLDEWVLMTTVSKTYTSGDSSRLHLSISTDGGLTWETSTNPLQEPTKINSHLYGENVYRGTGFWEHTGSEWRISTLTSAVGRGIADHMWNTMRSYITFNDTIQGDTVDVLATKDFVRDSTREASFVDTVSYVITVSGDKIGSASTGGGKLKLHGADFSSLLGATDETDAPIPYSRDSIQSGTNVQDFLLAEFILEPGTFIIDSVWYTLRFNDATSGSKMDSSWIYGPRLFTTGDTASHVPDSSWKRTLENHFTQTAFTTIRTAVAGVDIPSGYDNDFSNLPVNVIMLFEGDAADYMDIQKVAILCRKAVVIQ